MERQHLSQTKSAIAPPQTQTHASDRSSAHPIEELQGAIGNRAVNQLLANQPTLQAKPMFGGLSRELVIQPKLTIGAVGDKYEQEADRVAKQVVSQMYAPDNSPIQRKQTPEEDEELQMKPIVQHLGEGNSMAVAPELEASIQQAKSGGQPLINTIRQPMEQVFGADFSGVKIHTDAQSDTLNRSIQARAFTTGQDIFFRQGTYNSGSRFGQELLAHELTHVVQQSGGSSTVQRAVGFEFQTNWGVIEKKRSKFKNKRKPFRKGEILHSYPSFKLTADEADTVLGAEIEWVVDPPIPESAGVSTLDRIMQKLQVEAAKIVRLQMSDKFTLDRATGDARDSFIEVQPNIKGPFRAQNMKSNPQVTGGVRLDQMATMFSEVGNHNVGAHHQQARNELMHMGGQKLIADAATVANTIVGSDKLKGLAAQIVAYLQAGALGGINPTYRQAYDYAKLIGKIMARTDFGSQFQMLGPNERLPFQQNPDTFATLILNAAVLPGNVHVFERKIKVDTRNPDRGVFNFPVTRQDWLVGITKGKDMLSSKHMPQWKSELEGLGALGNKTDDVGANHNEQGSILEFRSVKEQMPYTDWRDFATRTFAYLIDLNQRLSPQQQIVAAFDELPQGSGF